MESNMERWGEYVFNELRVNFLKRPTKKSFLMRMF